MNVNYVDKNILEKVVKHIDNKKYKQAKDLLQAMINGKEREWSIIQLKALSKT
jgi:hypothetical protein